MNTCYLPTHGKYPFLDSFVYRKERRSHVITFFQVTMGQKHPMKSEELDKIAHALAVRYPCQNFRYRYVAVVPYGEEPDLTLSKKCRQQSQLEVYALQA